MKLAEFYFLSLSGYGITCFYLMNSLEHSISTKRKRRRSFFYTFLNCFTFFYIFTKNNKTSSTILLYGTSKERESARGIDFTRRPDFGDGHAHTRLYKCPDFYFAHESRIDRPTAISGSYEFILFILLE